MEFSVVVIHSTNLRELIQVTLVPQNSSQLSETGISKQIASNFPGSPATKAVLGTKNPILSSCFY